MTDPPSPDPALLELFRAELETHLATLSSGMLALEKSPDDLRQLESLMRAAHSIKGAARIVGFEAAVQVSHHLEDCFVAAQRGQIALTCDAVDVLLRGVDALGRLGTPSGSGRGGTVPPEELEHWVAEIAAVRSGQLAPRVATVAATVTTTATAATTTAASQAAVLEFVNEAKEHLANVVRDLLVLEQRPAEADAPCLQRLLRAMHSIKGGAGFVGCRTIEQLAHAMESVLEALPQSGMAFDAALVDTLLAGSDRIQALVDDAQRSNEADVSDIVQRLQQCLAEPTPAADDTPPVDDVGHPRLSEPPVALAEPARSVDEPQRGPDRSASVRIPVPLVDQLMTLAGELVLVRNQALRSIESGEAAIRPVLQRLDALTSQLQGAVTQTRMQPVGNLFARFPRTVRDMARQMGKSIELEVSGTEVELDKSVLELLSDPLTHLIRNCCDHGLETPDQRASAGKPAAGRITLGARQQGGQIYIEVRDDGQGIDVERLRSKILASGLRTEADLARLSDKETLALITLPGFSTASTVTDLSGRGVGMDVVKTNLDRLGGTLEIDSTLGQGTTFTLRVPLTLAIIPCLMVRVQDQCYAIPQKDLEELVCLHPEPGQPRIENTMDQEVVRLRGRLLPLVRLSEVLERPAPLDTETREAIVRSPRPDTATFFAVVRVGERRFGLIVDQILKNEEIVVKPMHGLLKPLTCFSGATILGDGQVALILNMEGIGRHAGVRFGEHVPREQPGDGSQRDETAPVLLFRYGPDEQFAVPLAMIRRLVMVDPQRIERVGSREFLLVDGVTTPLLRLDQVLPVSAAAPAHPLFLLLPKNIKRPLGLLATSILDADTLPSGITHDAFRADGVVGSTVLRGRMTLLLDLCRLAEQSDPTGTAASTDETRSRQGKILVVDDTEFFRELVRGYLDEAGYEAVSAVDGAQAIRMLESDAFDLVVSDIEMPGMDGWTLAKAIRQRSNLTGLPLLALTTLDSDADRVRARSCGFNGYEVKLDRQQFLRTVAKLLGEQRKAHAR
ncbi:MAG: chemotaxis protein CheW [Pirellulaceae bacterium]|nr:chemotaxis protein CheW [Pirellulaceae bacterium]